MRFDVIGQKAVDGAPGTRDLAAIVALLLRNAAKAVYLSTVFRYGSA